MNQPLPLEDWSERSKDLAALLARCGLSDRAAFAELYRRTSAQLYAVVLRIQRDAGQAEELLQDIYVSIWRAAASFDAAQSQPLTWMTRIARNRAIDSLRRAQAQPQTVSLDDDDADEPAHEHAADAAAEPLNLLNRAADARQVQHCMQALSAQQRQSVALAFYDGLSHSEVATHLRQPLGTVKSWLRRALMSIKDCLDKSARREAVAAER